ncbi:glycoside hydrolase family 43 protein [Cadophora sp. DSE1049]|nr:glycoside hydrolase family 43 protein [Cadophora sp. DSE1049]
MAMSCIVLICLVIARVFAHNSTYFNPILPGFHPDPSCIFVPEKDNTFFCASSSFLAFPGLPIHASRDLRGWRLISNALSRPSQLPDLASVRNPSGGIWAPTLRYHRGLFYLFTTLVLEDLPINASSRWDNFFVTSNNPYKSSSWSEPIHFSFEGYDPSVFWDQDNRAYVTGAHAWQISPGINQVTINLKTGSVGDVVNIWNGTGRLAPEGPHLYRKDGYFYLMIAEGGTGRNHQETIARSRNINGPYTSNPANPVLTNANTTSYFQAVGHADLFQDAEDQWWACALAIRVRSDNTSPMGRETVLTPVTWREGEWPTATKVSGEMDGWNMGSRKRIPSGEGSMVDADHYHNFAPRSVLPPEFLYFRIPDWKNYLISPRERPYSLRLQSSMTNLSGPYDISGKPQPPTFIGQRQTHTYFTFSVELDVNLQEEGQEAGVTVFLDQNNHYEFGMAMLPDSAGNSLAPHFRLRGFSDIVPSPAPILSPVPNWWLKRTLVLQIQASNHTHFSFSVGLASARSEMRTIGYGRGIGLSWKFTGVLAGVYATTNGAGQAFPAYISSWSYKGQGQLLS